MLASNSLSCRTVNVSQRSGQPVGTDAPCVGARHNALHQAKHEATLPQRAEGLRKPLPARSELTRRTNEVPPMAVGRVLVVSGEADIEQKIERYLEAANVHAKDVIYLTEYYGKSPVPPDRPNAINMGDFADRAQVDTALQKLVECDGIDHVVNINEYSMSISAEIREMLALPGVTTEQSRRFRDKLVMKEALQGFGVACPRVYAPQELPHLDVEKFPIVAKPRSCAGSLGVSILSTPTELKDFLQKKSIQTDACEDFVEFSEDNLEFEEFIQGAVHTLDGLVYQGDIVFVRPSLQSNTCLDFINSTAPHGAITLTSPAEIAAWSKFAQNVHRGLQIPDGAFHLEAFLTADGRRIFLEIGARPGGAHVVPTVRHAWGVDLEQAHFTLQLGIPPQLPPSGTPARASAFMCYPLADYTAPEGQWRVRSVETRGCENLPTVALASLPKPGDSASGMFVGYVQSTLGNFVLAGDTFEEVGADLALIASNYRVTTERVF